MASAVSSAIGMSQHMSDTSLEADLADHNFAESQHLLQHLSTDALKRKAALFTEECAQERRLAAKQKAQAMELARRECLRDTWVAHNGHIQASLFVATVLIGFGYEILSGAIISDTWEREQPGWVTVFFAATVMSIAFGLASLSLLLVRYRRLAEYNFENPWQTHACGHTHGEIMEYIECRCRSLQKWAHLCLIASATLGTTAMMIYAFDKFQNNIGGTTGARDYNQSYDGDASSSSSAAALVNNTASSTTANSVRTIGAPVVFCLIVGCSVAMMMILDFVVLRSDTLVERPTTTAITTTSTAATGGGGAAAAGASPAAREPSSSSPSPPLPSRVGKKNHSRQRSAPAAVKERDDNHDDGEEDKESDDTDVVVDADAVTNQLKQKFGLA